ncbi:DUF2442 domain-containing protein [Zoogloea sp.]|uniref:DUF2442 domain-containing protein n=1 Tax=Zoogloea sp. TaxID=49181 RepID=UPI00321FA157
MKTVKPLADYRLCVETVGGRSGVFDMKPYLDRGVFRELRDPGYFNRVGIVLGAVTWPNEQDIAPETLLAGLVGESAEALVQGHSSHLEVAGVQIKDLTP